MRCLVLNPGDDPVGGAWTGARWDRVVDFGIAGPTTYKRWTKVLGCEVEPCPDLGREDFARLRAMYQFGLGRMVDRDGLDWWDLTWLRWMGQMVESVRATKFTSSLGNEDEVFVNSPTYFRMLDALAPGRVRRLDAEDSGSKRTTFGRLRRLNFSQVLEILGDKYDGTYRWRRLVAPPMANCAEPVVLLPSAYGNASRTALTLASSLPEQQFLLVATRRSACVHPVPSNVKRAQLASYPGSVADRDEMQDLLIRWRGLLQAFEEDRELNLLREMGCFDRFSFYLQEGLAIRNCWVSVFDNEPVTSLLCADEKNAYTRIPILLARQRGIPSVACHHGALDGRYRFTHICADRFLAKSEMEWEYLVKGCGVPKGRIQRSTAPESKQAFGVRQEAKHIVFYSEPYELAKCRAAAVYAEVLPSLARIAKEHGRELVIKLHPFESRRERVQLVEQALPGADRGTVRFVSGPMTKELIEQTWFSVTVTSSAAVDCAAQGVPAFLCLWLDRYGFGYGEQYVKSAVAMPLRTAEEVVDIPKRLERFDNTRIQEFSPNVTPELLREILLPVAAETSNACEVEKLWA